jgi:hypothetical protein
MPSARVIQAVDILKDGGFGLAAGFPCPAPEFATLEWVDWFNNRRLLVPISYIPPAEADERYDASLDQPAMAA